MRNTYYGRPGSKEEMAALKNVVQVYQSLVFPMAIANAVGQEAAAFKNDFAQMRSQVGQLKDEQIGLRNEFNQMREEQDYENSNGFSI